MCIGWVFWWRASPEGMVGLYRVPMAVFISYMDHYLSFLHARWLQFTNSR